MEHGARLSTSRVMAIAFILCQCLLFSASLLTSFRG